MATATALTPHLVVNGGKAAVEFYKAAFGATEQRVVPAEDGKRLMHAEIHFDGLKFYLCDEFPEHDKGGPKSGSPKTMGGVSVTLHVAVSNCDEAVARAKAAGATVTMEPWDAFWGDRYAQIVDPFGHSWSFSHPLKK